MNLTAELELTCPKKLIQVLCDDKLNTEGRMPRKRYTPEEIIHKLREAEILLSQGQTVGEVARQLEISEQS